LRHHINTNLKKTDGVCQADSQKRPSFLILGPHFSIGGYAQHFSKWWVEKTVGRESVGRVTSKNKPGSLPIIRVATWSRARKKMLTKKKTHDDKKNPKNETEKKLFDGKINSSAFFYPPSISG